MRLEYDVTLDDQIDTTRRAMARSKTVRSLRSRSIWIPTLISGPVVLGTWRMRSGSTPEGPVVWAALIGVAIMFSILAYFWARWYYDWTVSRRIRRIVLEQFGKASVPCEIELRPETLWTRQNGTEITFPWRDIEEVVDTGDAIELQFKNGLTVARNRVFTSPGQRAEFLNIAQGSRSLSRRVQENS